MPKVELYPLNLRPPTIADLEEIEELRVDYGKLDLKLTIEVALMLGAPENIRSWPATEAGRIAAAVSSFFPSEPS